MYFLTGPFCGSKIPAVIDSTTNELVIRFYADFFIEAKGFYAHWTTDSTLPTPTEPPVPPNPWDDIKIGMNKNILCHVTFNISSRKLIKIKG